MPNLTKENLATMSGSELQFHSYMAENEVVACLPAQILQAASKFVSDDYTKDVLTKIYIAKEPDDRIIIASTDGHRAFRFRFATNEKWSINNEAGFILLDAQAVKKKVSYAQYAIFKKESIEFFGGKKKAHQTQEPFDFIEARPCKYNVDQEYPKLNQLWPDTFTNEPGRPIAWNASYLSDFLAVVTQLGVNNVVKMQSNAATTPLTFTGKCELPGFEESLFEYLLMPVQIRE